MPLEFQNLTPPSPPLPSYTSVGCGEEADCRRAAFLLKLVLRRLALGADYGCIALAVTHHITGSHQVQFTVANVWRHPAQDNVVNLRQGLIPGPPGQNQRRAHSTGACLVQQDLALVLAECEHA